MADEQSPFDQFKSWVEQPLPPTPPPPMDQPAAPTPDMPAWRLLDPRGMTPIIKASAAKYNIDPDVALRVAQSEGLSTFFGDNGKSGGAFQLYTGGGMGNEFQKETGLDPLDPKNEQATVDYALRRVSKEGWSAFHGAANVGIGQWDGITPPPGQRPEAAPQSPFEQLQQFVQSQAPMEGAPKPPAESPGLFGGLSAGLTDIRQATIAMHALWDKATGDENGARDLMDTFQTLEQEKAAHTKFHSIQDLYDNGSVGDVVNYVLYNLGEQIPNVAMIAAGGGLSGFIGKRLGMMVAEGMIDETAANAIVSKFGSRAALVGAYTAATAGQTIPAITGEQYQATGDIYPGVALGFGAIAGIPAVAGPLAIGARLGLPTELADQLPEAIRSGVSRLLGDGFLARRASGAAVYGLEMGGAAAVQQAVQDVARAYVDQNFQLLGPESAKRILNAAANGTLMGSVFGSVTNAHPYDDAISDKLFGAFGLKDKTPGPISRPTKITDPEVNKIFPESDNPSVETVNQVLREKLVEAGSIDSLNEKQRKFLADNPNTLESLNFLKARIEQEITKDFRNKGVTADDGRPFNPATTVVDWKDQTVSLVGNGGEFAVRPLSDVPLRELAIRTLDTMTDQYGRVIPFMRLIPEGYKLSKFADIDVGSVPLHRNDADLAAIYSTSSVVDTRGKAVDMSKGLKDGQVVFAHSQDGRDALMDSGQRKVLQGVLRRWAPGAKVIIDTHELGSPVNRAMGSDQGYMESLGDNKYLVFLPQDAFSRFTQLHEIGHVVAWHSFAKASFARKLLFYHAYRNELRDFSGNDLMDLAERVNNPGSLLWKKQDGSVGNGFKDWFDFDEWMAEGFTRAMLDQHGKLIDYHFGPVAERIKGALKDLGIDAAKLKPHEVMASWFDSLYRQQPIGMEMMAGDALKSSAANAEHTDTKLDPSDDFATRMFKSPPEAAENEPLRPPMAQGLVSRPIKARADKFSWFTRWMWNTPQLVKLYPHIEPLRRTNYNLEQFGNYKALWGRRSEDVAIMQRNLGKVKSKLLDKIEYAVDRMGYLGKNEAARHPNMTEFKKIIQDAGAAKDWKDIEPVWNAKRKAYDDALTEHEQIAIKRANEITDLANRQTQITKIQQETANLRSKPYMPHMRYGDYSVMIKDAAGKKLSFSMHWTQREAQKAAKELMAQFPGSKATLDRLPDEVRQWTGLPPTLLDSVKDMPGITAVQKDWLDNLRYDMSPENSFAKRFMHRSGLPGYDMNSLRSFANYFSSMSGHIARLKYGRDIDQAVDDVYASARTDFQPMDIKGKTARVRLGDWLRRQADYTMHPPNEFHGVRSLAFQWWLGFNPSTAFVHAMQMPMFTAPYMSKAYGIRGLMRVLGAYADMRQLYKDPAKSKLEPEYLRGQTRAGAEGILTENRGSELAAWADHGRLNRMMQGTNVQRGLALASGGTAWVMRQVEKNNRLVTFRAAWKAALDNPNSKYVLRLVAQNDGLYRQLLNEGERPEVAAAYIAARDAVKESHFTYSQLARPRWQRGIMNPLTPFMMYKQQALWFFMHNPAGMRAAATMFAISGVTGLPFAQDMMDLFKQVSEWMGHRVDPNLYMQEVAKELTGHPEVVMHGFGRTGLGMQQLFNSLGMPVSGFDVSRRLGYGELVPGIPEWTRDQQESFYERFGKGMAAMLGAGAEVPISLASAVGGMSVPYALSKLLEGDPTWATVRGLEPIMPAVMRNIETAARYAAQGGDVGPQGEMRTPLDMHDSMGWSAVLERALGFTPTGVSESAEVTDTAHQLEAYWNIRKANLSRQFVQARLTGDQQGITDTLAAVREFNRDVPLRGVKIQAKSLVASMKDAMRRRAEERMGRSKSGAMQIVRPAFPEYQPPNQGTGILPYPQP